MNEEKSELLLLVMRLIINIAMKNGADSVALQVGRQTIERHENENHNFLFTFIKSIIR